MRIRIEGLSETGLRKYRSLSELKITEIESDFLEDAITIHCSPTPEARDKLFIWCDKNDLMATSED